MKMFRKLKITLDPITSFTPMYLVVYVPRNKSRDYRAYLIATCEKKSIAPTTIKKISGNSIQIREFIKTHILESANDYQSVNGDDMDKGTKEHVDQMLYLFGRFKPLLA